MYPISFDNPNQPKGRSGRISALHSDPAPSQEQPTPANRNQATAPGNQDAGGRVDTQVMDAQIQDAQASSLLVVECRRDDRWQVELCTDLSELDSALDMARALRQADDVDEVCLTLEVSGAHGRESRREVLRFAPEIVAVAAPAPAVSDSSVRTPAETMANTDAMAVLHAALKAPDYCLDELDFSQFALPELPTPVDQPEGHKEDHSEDYMEDSLSLNEGHARQEARGLLSSLYSDGPDSHDDDLAISPHGNPAIRVTIPPKDPNHHGDWLGYTDIGTSHRPSPDRGKAQGEFANNLNGEFDGDPDDAILRLEAPLLDRSNGLATKLLVFAGAVALLVLGGAIAELLAVDITTAANAGVGTFDTMTTVQGALTP